MSKPSTPGSSGATGSAFDTAIVAMERIISRDPAGRNIAALVQPGHLAAAAHGLISAEKVLIAAGFYVPSAGAGETDGPPGAKTIGDTLGTLGAKVEYVTDDLNAPYLREIGAEPLLLYGGKPYGGKPYGGKPYGGKPHSGDRDAEHLLDQVQPNFLLAIERLGRAADGRYYNMRGEDVSEFTAPVDELFLRAAAKNIPTVGIGDGGNEIGMGRCVEEIHAHVKHGERIACIVPTDHLIVSGVSNWGAYGLVGALSLLAGRDLLPDAEKIRAQVEAIVALGGVDGVTTRGEATVDGLPLQESYALLAELRALL